MTAPALFYSFLLATFLAAVFHLWKGGSGGRLVFLLILSWIGFYIGHRLGTAWKIRFLMIGPIQGGLGALGSLVVLFLGNWFTRLDKS